MRLRRLLLLDLVLLAAAAPGVFNVLAKDRVSTAEGVLAWASALVLLLALLGLLVLAALGLRRLARRGETS